MEHFSSPRTFQIWDYHVTFRRLLLRSVPITKGEEAKNIDIIFGGVFYLDMPAMLAGIALDTPTNEELARLELRTGTPQDQAGKGQQYFVLVSGGHRYYVGALGMSITENTLDMMETSLEIRYQLPR